jgi:hypothetical protein
VPELGRAAVCVTNGREIAALTQQKIGPQICDVRIGRIEEVQSLLRLDELSLIGKIYDFLQLRSGRRG